MTLTDPIADMLTRIRNACAVKKERVKIPYSKFKFEIARILEKLGYINGASTVGRVKKFIDISLKYENGKPVIKEIRRISKPGRRIYIGAKKAYPFRAGRRLIISTSKGLLTDVEARKLKVGGEVLFEIW
jgi:small subunit ribosomal protein S8